MSRKINFRKIFLVIFITILIWFWADQAKTEDFPVAGATITVAKSTEQNLWVSFPNEKSSVPINRIVLRGAASKITEVKRKLNEGSLKFEFFLDPQQYDMTSAKKYSLSVLDFLKKNDQIKNLGLSVEACIPEEITVNVVVLTQKLLNVKCIDSDQNPVKDVVIDPAQIQAYVPGDWEGEKLTAYVQLTQGEINQARSAPIEKMPYIILAPGQTREAAKPVKITTPRQEDVRKPDTIKSVTLGFIFSANTEGKYKAEVVNLTEVMSPISIRATAEAKRAYENLPYQVILEIHDDDIKSTEPIKRELTYNFPAEYLRKDEIVLNQQRVNARFRLIPINNTETTTISAP